MAHVFVKFYQDDGSPSRDIFVFFSQVRYLPGTCVIVQAQKTIKAAVVCEPPADHPVRKLAPTKHVLAAVTEWQDDRKFLDSLINTELARELDVAVKKLPCEALYELAASRDPHIKKLYDRYKGAPEEKPAEEQTVAIKLSKCEMSGLRTMLQLVHANKIPWGASAACRIQALHDRLEHADLNPFVMRLSDAEELAGWLKLSRDSKLPITPVEDRLLTAIMRVRSAGMFDGDAKRIRDEEKAVCYPVLPGDAPEYLKVAICPGCGRAGCDGACKAEHGKLPYDTNWISENEFVEFSCVRTSKDFLRKVFLENWEEGVRLRNEACRVDFSSGQKLMRLYQVPGEQRMRIPMFVDVGDAPTKAKPKEACYTVTLCREDIRWLAGSLIAHLPQIAVIDPLVKEPLQAFCETLSAALAAGNHTQTFYLRDAVRRSAILFLHTCIIKHLYHPCGAGAVSESRSVLERLSGVFEQMEKTKEQAVCEAMQKPKDVIKVERQPIPTTPCDLSRLSAGKVRLDGDVECVRPEDQDGLSASSELIGGE